MAIPTRTLASIVSQKRFPVFGIMDGGDANPIFGVLDENGVTTGLGINYSALFDSSGKIEMTGNIAASDITTAMLAAASVTGPKLSTGVVKVSLLVGQDETSSPNYTLAAMAATDEVVFVGVFVTAASIASLTDRTTRYTAGAGVLTTANNAAVQTNNQLFVVWVSHT